MIRVGYGPTTAYDEMPRIRVAMARNHPGVEVRAEETWGAGLEASIRHGRLDAALGRHLSAPPGYRSTVLARHRYLAGVSAAHPAARRKQIKLADLHGQPLRLFPRHQDPAYYDAVVSAAASTGTDFEVWENPVPDLRHIRTRRSAAGFILIPAPLAAYLPGIAALQVSDELPPCELQLAWRTAPGENARAVDAFVSCAATTLSAGPPGAREH